MDNPSPPSEPEQSSNPEEEVNEAAESVERPKFRPTDKSDLKGDRHMEANDQAPKVGSLTAIGKLFGSLQADAFVLADLIKSYAVAVVEVAKNEMRPGDQPALPGVSRLGIESVHIDFVVGANEPITMEEDSQPAIRAARVVSDLMKARDDELLELAREIGEDGAKAYRKLLKVIGDADDAKVTWEAPGRAAISISSIEAAKAHRTMSREGESESDDFTVLGRLSMADEYKNRFELRLHKGAPRPSQVKGKRLIKGTFDHSLGEFVKEQNLWGKDVEAAIHVERERADTVATPRDPSFVLVSVQGSTAPPAPRNSREPMPGSAALDEGIDADVFGDSD